MIRKLFVIVSILGFSIPLHATRAKMDALGTNSDRYFDMIERVFYNPAVIIENSDQIILQLGTAGTDDAHTGAGVSRVKQENFSDMPSAEGGFFHTVGSFTWGLYFGKQDNRDLRRVIIDDGSNSSSKTTSFAFTNASDQNNPLEFFIAGDNGMLWGASIKTSWGKDEQRPTAGPHLHKQSSLALKGGVVAGGLEGYVNLGIFDKADGGALSSTSAFSKAEFDANLSFLIGAQYAFDDYIVYLEFSKTGYEYKDGVTGVKSEEYDRSSFKFGTGKTFSMDNNSKMFLDVYLFTFSDELKQFSPNKIFNWSRWYVPITIGYESQVLKWLTLRGSIEQKVLSRAKASTKRKTWDFNSTNVNAGLGIMLGALELDALIGLSNSSTDAQSKKGRISFDNLLSRISTTYRF